MRRVAWPAAALVAATIQAGCLLREETIVVRPDGSASIAVELEGDEDDLATGDTIAAPRGWTAFQTKSLDSRGRRQVEAVWRGDLADLNDAPVSFSAPGDPHAAASLRWETSLRVERRPGSTVYHFTRRYVGRRSRMYDQLRQKLVPEDLARRAEEGQGLELQERERLFEGLAAYESAAILARSRNALGRAAVEGLIDPASQKDVLEDMETILKQRLDGPSLQRMFLLPEDRQAAEHASLRNDLRDRMERSADQRSRPRLRTLIDEEERHFDVTQDLTDEIFSLTVTLPGMLVSANTTEIHGSRVSWEFEGKDLLEGDLVLTAVAVAAP